jgi:hypothetical protein
MNYGKKASRARRRKHETLAVTPASPALFLTYWLALPLPVATLNPFGNRQRKGLLDWIGTIHLCIRRMLL